MNSVSMFEIGNEVDFLRTEAMWLRLRYPKIPIVPLLYRVEDNRLYHVQEETVEARVHSLAWVRRLKAL